MSPRYSSAVADFRLGLQARSIDHLKSAATTGRPLLKVTPRRSLNVNVFASSEIDHDSARFPTAVFWGDQPTSPSNTCCVKSIVSVSWTRAGSTCVGLATSEYLKTRPLPADAFCEKVPRPQPLRARRQASTVIPGR